MKCGGNDKKVINFVKFVIFSMFGFYSYAVVQSYFINISMCERATTFCVVS